MIFAIAILLLLWLGLFGMYLRNRRAIRETMDMDNHTEPIPKHLVQTTNVQPPERINQVFGTFPRTIFSDEKEISRFLMLHYGPKIANAYQALKLGAHRADLFRYCYLYQFGGIYLDIKTIPLRPLEEIFRSYPGVHTSYACLAWDKASVFNAIIATPPKNPAMFEIIEYIAGLVEDGNDFPYNAICAFHWKILQRDYGATPNAGTFYDRAGRRLELLEERGSTSLEDTECRVAIPNYGKRIFDRYQFCVNVYDQTNQAVFIARDPEYPWR